ncbi:MAG: glycosyltransferase [Solirubrobacteraceae bacterium]|nr:glycosyltransferase [Solirubrobacteraceae bacterium]
MPHPSAIVAIPTTGRPDHLDHALRSVLPQARAHGVDVVVVDDGPSATTRDLASRHGVGCITHPRRRGLNASRNAAIAATDADLVCFLDDDAEVTDGWLAALLDAAAGAPDAAALGGPVLARLAGRDAARDGALAPPISHLDLGPRDRDCDRLWGANLTVRRAAIDAIGPFDPSHQIYGDEEEWLARALAAGWRVRYVAAAAVLHHRSAAESTTRELARTRWRNGQASRRADLRRGDAPGIAAEAVNVARNAAGLLRHRDPSHLWAASHAVGRLHEAALGYPPAGPATPGVDDFLSGTSGHVAGRRARLLAAHDRWLDLRLAARGVGRRLDALAATAPAEDVLVVIPARPGNADVVRALRGRLASRRHRVDLRAPDPAGRPRFVTVQDAIDEATAGRDAPFDRILLVDDDIELPRRFLDRFVGLCSAADLDLAQPAHRRHGHAAWPITRRRPGTTWRRTTFVEIGPLTAFSARACDVLLPFDPAVGMGWGLDAHWAAVADAHGLRCGIVDALPVGHLAAPPATAYGRDGALADARALLADRPYLPRWEITTVEDHVDPPGPR